MAKFVNPADGSLRDTPVVEHWCPDHWEADPDHRPHERCSICHKRHILSNSKVIEIKRMEATATGEILEETFEIQVHSKRDPGKDWDGHWVKWTNKNKKTSSWTTLKRIKASVAQITDMPEMYRIVKVYTKPAIVKKIEIIEEVSNSPEVDFIRQDFSKRNLDEAAKPTYNIVDDEN